MQGGVTMKNTFRGFVSGALATIAGAFFVGGIAVLHGGKR